MRKTCVVGVLVVAVFLGGCSSQGSSGSSGQQSSSSPAAPVVGASGSSSGAEDNDRYGHYGEPANSPGPGAYAGWSKEEQKTATEFAVSSMRIFAMKTDAKTWHLYMDPRVTDGYKKQLERYNPQYGSVNTVYQAVYTEFPPDAKKAVVRVETDAGVWVVHLQREGAGEAPKVALIEPLNLGRGH